MRDLRVPKFNPVLVRLIGSMNQSVDDVIGEFATCGTENFMLKRRAMNATTSKQREAFWRINIRMMIKYSRLGGRLSHVCDLIIDCGFSRVSERLFLYKIMD